MTRYEWRKKAKEMTKNQDIQTKAMELKGQQQYDYLLELLSRAKAEGRASAFSEMTDLSLYKRGRAEMLQDVLKKIDSLGYPNANFLTKELKKLKAMLTKKK